ncbi:MAG: hypothetical protein IPI59_15670 [Sphingobacteriales bacterium]|jgi:hypothetical protein|nr:hypothetical protein [Sphingobacteriales bacterium]MCC7057995.1 hypothetical protein [Chitinophagales bacterium]MDA0199969.1 hypothetical protein [Bacteroidota bacterium]MBK6888557.1 hypothetical protein [Sphingobacteriales bacterium]MBK7528935.1 hypothetical protein [Sphingobacteriales bacterium]
MNIRQLVANIITSNAAFVTAKVITIDKEQQTIDCAPITGDADLLDVKLQPSVVADGLGVLLYPKIGSIVITASTQDGSSFVAMYSEIDEVNIVVSDNIKIRANSNGINITSPEIVINDGNNGALIVWERLLAELQKIVLFLDTLKTTIQTAVPAPGDGGAAIKLALTTALTPLSTPQFNNITNTKVKH